MASYNGAVLGGMAQGVSGTTSLVLDAAGVERTIGGWAMYVSGGLVQAGEGITCPPDSGPANREVPQIVRAVP